MPKNKKTNSNEETNEAFPGYPHYPEKEDIYDREEKELLPEEKIPASGLDVPGAELDDKMEDIGEEDEENNYYSLGGDDHNDLEEDQGD